jgi:hypothetical protein
MLGENGFCDHRAHTAWPSDAHKGGDGMDKEENQNQITHARF